MRGGKKSGAGKRPSCGVVHFCAAVHVEEYCKYSLRISKRSCLSRWKDHSVLELEPGYKSTR